MNQLEPTETAARSYHRVTFPFNYARNPLLCFNSVAQFMKLNMEQPSLQLHSPPILSKSFTSFLSPKSLLHDTHTLFQATVVRLTLAEIYTASHCQRVLFPKSRCPIMMTPVRDPMIQFKTMSSAYSSSSGCADHTHKLTEASSHRPKPGTVSSRRLPGGDLCRAATLYA